MTTSYDVLGAAPGTALAPAWRPRRRDLAAVVVGPDEVTAAFAAAAARLDHLAASFRSAGATESADILGAEALIARDPVFLEEAISAVQGADGSSAAAAVQQVADLHAATMELLDSPVLRERAADIRQVGRMVVEQLAGGRREPPASASFVLVDEEVTAPDLLENAEQVVAAVSTRGSSSSHAAIVARSLGVPLVVEAPESAVRVPDGTLLLVDANRGVVIVSPDEPTQATVHAIDDAHGSVTGVVAAAPTTADGVDVSVLANIASAVEARRAVALGAAGVGLLRTELAFLDAPDWPIIGQHEAQLRPILQVLAGRPVTVRLLDFTNDKRPPFLVGCPPGNPLGLTTLLEHPWALEEQLRAVLSAGREVDVRVLLPMVVDAGQVESVRRRLGAVTVADGHGLVRLGAMVELPEAAERAAALAQVSDFLSLGTNDLTAATLGLARTDARLTSAMTAHPAVLRCVATTVGAAAAVGCPVSVCGDAAADPLVLPLLVGAGLRSFSVGVARLGDVRESLRGLDVRSCVDVFDRALSLSDESAVQRLVASALRTSHAC